MAATRTGALTATAEPRKVEVMAAILVCGVTCMRDTVVTSARELCRPMRKNEDELDLSTTQQPISDEKQSRRSPC